MYTTQVDLYEIIKRFTEPARTPETLIFVIYLRFRPARVLAICGRFRGPGLSPPGRFLGPPSATPQALLDASGDALDKTDMAGNFAPGGAQDKTDTAGHFVSGTLLACWLPLW